MGFARDGSAGSDERAGPAPAPREARARASSALHVCTLCEAGCGLRFEVEGSRILSVRGDSEDVFSRGYVCPKGIAIAELHTDPDRLRTPVRRTPSGDFEPIGWDEAMALAAGQLREVRDRHGADALAVDMGNPIVHNHGALLLRAAFTKALGTRNAYSAGSQDTSPELSAPPTVVRRSRRHCTVPARLPARSASHRDR
jgi:anaerobic selenocysteine-containing dehydrogenase